MNQFSKNLHGPAFWTEVINGDNFNPEQGSAPFSQDPNQTK